LILPQRLVAFYAPRALIGTFSDSTVAKMKDKQTLASFSEKYGYYGHLVDFFMQFCYLDS
jgi:hypothetical protein